jgi:hypothetical protein
MLSDICVSTGEFRQLPPPLELASPKPPEPLSFSASFARLMIASESCFGFEPPYLRICWLFLKMTNVGVLSGNG